ncbi:MAG TPA: hypothetical protein HPQ00_16735, partial [Magnetococcales bacterium]|nr:hypothetical protein [Magnetococcales bacterium]
MVLRMACLVVILFVGGQVWAEDLVFTLNNKTSLVLDSFFASPTGVGDWEDDILGVDVLGPGESIQINVN